MALDKKDLLYAHGLLCYEAQLRIFSEKELADRMCEVINNFQIELKDYLISDAKTFHVRAVFITAILNNYLIEPIGGW